MRRRRRRRTRAPRWALLPLLALLTCGGVALTAAVAVPASRAGRTATAFPAFTYGTATYEQATLTTVRATFTVSPAASDVRARFAADPTWNVCTHDGGGTWSCVLVGTAATAPSSGLQRVAVP